MKLMVINIFVLFSVLLISSASAIKITEVELNPEGDDTGHEWVELYSSSEYDLDDHYLLNNDGDVFNLSGEFTGYKVIEFSKQFLDNSNESVALKKWGDTGTIDSTEIFKDSKNNDLTWNLCDNDWEFVSSSKGEESSCTDSSSSSSNSSSSSSSSSSSNSSSSTSSSSQQSSSSNTTQASQPSSDESDDKIVLTPKKPANQTQTATNSTKNQSASQPFSFITKQEKIRLWIAYAFAFFCLVIIILLLWKKL